tara:strand:- start:476 stop:760 length:285 start_codon:yes stop_codon:yes gene_type:complete
MLRLFRKKTTLQAPLGRWGAIVRNTREDNSMLRENSIDFNSNWANHDHCGAESCQIINNEEEKTLQKVQKSNKSDVKSNNSESSQPLNILPFMI